MESDALSIFIMLAIVVAQIISVCTIFFHQALLLWQLYKMYFSFLYLTIDSIEFVLQ